MESLPEWDLNQQSLNSAQMLSRAELSGHEFNLHLEPSWYSYSKFIYC